jgi:hypothetical protein
VTFVGQFQRSAILLHRASPRAYDAVSSFLVRRVELRGSGAEVTVGTVLESSGEVGPVTGGWRSGRRRAFAATALATALAVAAAPLARRR